jgi:hypothetical protein
MTDFWTTVGSGEFARIIALSLGVSLSATGLAILLGLLPPGSAEDLHHRRGQRTSTSSDPSSQEVRTVVGYRHPPNVQF